MKTQKITLLLLMAALFLTACQKGKDTADYPVSPYSVDCGKLFRFAVYDSTFADTLTLDVWTPDGYDGTGAYPVLYMHDGQNIFDTVATWNHQTWDMDKTAGALIKNGDIEPIIIVGIHCLGYTRIGDMMPEKAIPYITDSLERAFTDTISGWRYRGDEYVSAIANTVKPFTDSLFATNPAAEKTAIMGSSMGGIVSLYAFCEQPDVFRMAGCISTHLGMTQDRPAYAEAIFRYVRENMPKQDGRKLYIDNGDQDVDYNYIPYFNALVTLVDSLGYNSAHLQSQFFPGQGHCEKDWSSRMELPLKMFYGK
ncbi:MAG: hypothetical protein MJ003_02130 [Paludibacteraceae bacterium]|nr:hypothetical protein [Paludibacteraceae bacterium]